MHVGTRIIYPDEVGLWDVDLLQISVYHGMKDNFEVMKNCVRRCREKGIRYVIHPIQYSLIDKEMFRSLKEMAEWSDFTLILHDEKTHDWKRITGEHGTHFKKLVYELQSVTPVSFENATDTRDVVWFWDNYADSITLDIGHVELSGIDSIEFVKSLDKEVIDKIQYVHLHRNNGWRNVLTDHWYITPDCKEVKALKELLRIKHDIGIILEINETDKVGENLELLKTLRDKLGVDAGR
jgi:hypothetical protein